MNSVTYMGVVARLDTGPDPPFANLLSRGNRFGLWHPELCHPVEHVDPNHRLPLQGFELPGPEPVPNDAFVPEHAVLGAGLLVSAPRVSVNEEQDRPHTVATSS